MLFGVLLAELSPIGPCPFLVNTPKLFLAEMDLPAFRVSGRDLDVDMSVVGVPVDGGHRSGVRKALLQVVIDHLARFGIIHLLIERVDDAVMGARLAAGAPLPP